MESIQRYAYKTSTDLSYEDSLDRVTELLKEQGFGILTEIDVKATLKKKIDLDYKPYKILGACNPPFAHQVLEAEGLMGVMLPCNFVVIDEGQNRTIAAMNPLLLAEISGNEAVKDVVKEVDQRIRKVFENI